MKKVFFTGHRTYSFHIDEMRRLNSVLQKFASEGRVDFYAGGAMGWDTIFENHILVLRDGKFPFIKLHLVLPCPPEEQTARWNKYDKEWYFEILSAADSVEIASEHYDKSCMKKRNERLAELGDVCVCYYDEKRTRSGTAQTVRLAEKHGKEIINILKM